VTWLPTYLYDELHFDLKDAGFLSQIPYIIAPFIATFSGFLVDKLSASGTVRLIGSWNPFVSKLTI